MHPLTPLNQPYDFLAHEFCEVPEIAALKPGLRSVPPNEQALIYDQLAMLPAEMVANIFVRLEKDMVLIHCTTVLKRWRYILLQQYPALWRTAIIDKPPFTAPATLVLPLIANNVQDLKFHMNDENIL
ncbi:hypothetical protein BJV82DRAFT_582576 [Fennellomyces sp. T-0311]|nr:hypothetical protein BJV82DRAFT_582576 [Fennellomyces sp. T-0311]